VVVVSVKAGLLHIEVLRPVYVGHRHVHEFKLPVHGARV
jgi:hypothetical protein